MKKLALFLIIVLAFILRFYRLGDYPALNADEAAIGYNAYSLIQTGMDEHGNSWPIHFQSFNDYKPGLYFYLVLPFVLFMGLNEWAVRIPGAALGVGTVLVIYLLVKELRIKKSSEIGNRQIFALRAWKLEILASALLAISPWHIHFSRGGWEVNVSTFFITLGFYLFLVAIKKPNIKTFVFCALSFALSLYTYHAARILVPLVGLGVVAIYHQELFKNFKKIFVALLLTALLVLPMVLDLFTSDVLSRASGVGIFADSGTIARINEQRGEHGKLTNLPARLFHNKAVNYGLAFLENWTDHFHGEFLFLSGDVIERNRVPETGQMYGIELLWIVAGVWFMVKNQDKGTKLILWWLIVAPMAAAVTFQSPHALRSHNMVVPLTIISAYGLLRAYDLILNTFKRRIYRYSVLSIMFLVFSWSFIRYEHMYWTHMAKEYPFSSQYGVKELVGYVAGNIDKYDRIVVTTRYDQPYILFLFYQQYPPKKFQANHTLTPRDEYGFSTVSSFGKFEFHPVDFDKEQSLGNKSLIVGTDEEVPDGSNVVNEIYGTNEHKYFVIVEK